MPDLLAPEVAALVPMKHIEQYFGPWMVEEERFRGIVDRVCSLDLNEHVRANHERIEQAAGDGKAKSTYQITDGVALFEVRGTMTKYGSSFSNAPGTVKLRRDIADAASNKDVSSILLVFDSPGGMSAGTHELHNAIAAAAKKKEVVAYADDLMASAAYFAASGASKIIANASAMVGSIGTYMVLQDWSALAAKEGVKVHVIRSGKFKGAGTQGTEITGEQLANFQKTVDSINEPFVQSVATGRKLSIDRARELADGQIHIASQAKSLGLIDGISSLEDVFASLKKGKGKRMSDTTEDTKPRAATIGEIKSAIPKADAEFLVGQIEKGATVEQATAAWARVLEERLEQKDKALAEQKAKAEQLEKEKTEQSGSTKKPGVSAVTSGNASSSGKSEEAGSATERWNDLVAKQVAAGKTESEAVIHVAKHNPELREQYCAEYTAANPQLLDKKRR